MSRPVYHTDAKGERWRVHDVAFGPPHAKPGSFRKLALGSGLAGYRFFVNVAGERWAYRFKPGDDRSWEPENLAEQRRRAEFVSVGKAERYDASEREPR